MSGARKGNRRKKGQLFGILAIIAGLFAVAGIIFLIIKATTGGSLFAKEEKTEYVAYDFKEVLLDEYGAPTGGGLLTGEATRYRVTVIATPRDAGTVSNSAYVTVGGSVRVDVTNINQGYEFEGWYIDGKKVSEDTAYSIVNIKADITVVAKFTVDMIDITTIVATDDGTSLHPGGGIVTGGGSLRAKSGEECVLNATAAEGYEFAYFQVDDEDQVYGNPEFHLVAKEPRGADGDNTYNVTGDVVITAVFRRINRVITAAVVPAAGDITIKTSRDSGTSIIDPDRVVEFDLSWNIPETFVQKTGSDGKPVDERRYEIDYISIVQYGSVYKNIDIYGSPLHGTRSLQRANNDYPESGNFEIYLVLRPKLAQDQGTFCAAGVAVPRNAGLVTGTGSSTLISTYNLKATANEGYKFDHWEWFDDGLFRTATTSEIFVRPNGYVTYKALFVPAYYNISLASSDPAEGGAVLGLGNVMADSKGYASTIITINATNGYEPDSGTYNMGGKSYTISFRQDNIDSNRYTFAINNITDDVALNIKYKKNTSIAKVTLWDDSKSETDNKVGFYSDLSLLNDSAASTDVTLNESLTPPSASLNIYAQETGSYKFKQWVSSNGNIIPAGTADTNGVYSTTVTVTGDTSFYAQFEQNKNTIKVVADPVTNKDGTTNKVEIFDDSSGIAESKGIEDTNVTAGSSRRLVATPDSGKHFLYWTNSEGSKLAGVTDTTTHVNTLTLTNINWSDKYTAHFVDDNLEVGVDVSDPDAGTAQLNDKAPVSIYTTYNDIPYEETIYLKAEPKSGYRFVRWDIITYDGAKQESRVSYADPAISLVYIVQDIDCVAVFEKSNYTIKVASNPVAGGKATVNGMNDQAEVDEGGKAVLEATPSSDYTFEYWTDLAGNKYTDNPYTIDSVNGNDTYTAHFVSNNIAITTMASPANGGTLKINGVSVSSGTKTIVSAGENVTLSAEPLNGYKFVRWESMGESGQNPVAYADKEIQLLNVTQSETYTAVFSDNTYTIKVAASPMAGGSATASGHVNEASYLPGEQATLQATPAENYKFDYWTDSAGNRFTQNPYVISSVTENDTFTAHFVKGKISITAMASPASYGTIKINGLTVTSGTERLVSSGENVTLSAEPLEGYKFVRWESMGESGQNPVAYADKEIQLLNVTQSETYTAVFSDNTYTIKVAASPMAGGSATASGHANEASYVPGEQATLQATPAADYKFDYWTDSAGNRFMQNPYVISSVTENDTFTAHFVKGKISIKAMASPASGGTLKINGSQVTSGTEKLVSSGENVTLSAEPLDGYRFVRWESKGESGQSPVAYADKEIQLLNVTQSETYTAVFSSNVYTIKVVSSPMAGGTSTASGHTNEASYLPGEQATLQATPAKGYKFDCWTDSAGNKFTQNPYVISSVTGNDTFTAHYIPGKPAITIDATPQEAGVVKLNGNVVSNGSVNEIESGSKVTLTAEVTNESKYVFERWESSKGTVSTSNPLQLVNVTEPETYTAVFNLKIGKTGIKLLSSPASGGQATKTIAKDGKSAMLKAVPRPGYSFVEWKKDGIVISKSAVFVVTDMTDGTTYTAVFVKTGDVDVRSDIINEYFYNENRRHTEPNYSVTRQSMEAQAKAHIEAEKSAQYDDSTPAPKDYKAVEAAKDIFNDIELVKDDSVVMLDGELVTTSGEIMPLTVVSDSHKEETAAKDFTQKKYGKRYTYEIIACKDVGIPDGFEDGVRTYIWKYQDIDSKDNIYILYEKEDGKTDWVSCTIDAGASLKFTIDSIGNGVRMTIVKVIVE